MKKISLIIPISFATLASVGCQLNRQYTVNFKNYDGSILQSTKIDGGKKATYTGDTPTRAGDQQYTYTFSGWDKSLDDEIRADTDFVAQFTSTTNKYTVTFNTRGGSAAPDKQTIEYGKTATKPSEPTRATYTFVDWYTDDYQRFDFSTPIKSDLTLYAGWGHTVTFEHSDTKEEYYPKQIVPVGWYAVNPGFVEPSEQQLCYGWKNKNGGAYFDFNTEITEDTKLAPAFGNVELEIVGGHNININSSNPGTLQAYGYDGGQRSEDPLTKDNNLVWKVLEGYENIININEDGKLSIPSNSPGGTAYILAYINNNQGGGGYFYGVHEVQVASFSYINTDEFIKDENPIIKGTSNSMSGKLVIPEKYWDGEKWIASGEKEIAKGAFSGCNQLTSVVIPENVTSIGENAFRCIEVMPPYGATGNIRNVTFKGTPKVKTIGIEAFDGQRQLSSFKIPASVENIGNAAFYNCPLTSITFGDQTNVKWNLTPSNIASVGQAVQINVKDYTDAELAKGFTVYSWDDENYGKGDYNWAKVTS